MSTRPPTLCAVAALAACVGAAGCAYAPHADAQRLQLTGVVTGTETSPPRIVVAHDRLGEFMPAMTMALEAAPDSPPVHAGQRIVATLVVTRDRSWLENVRVAGAGEATAGRARQTVAAVVGASLPALPFIDQDGRVRSLRDFTGRILILTFIYTRCPLPDFCPLMVRHLERVRRRADEAGIGDRVALLGVTLDPGFDTPAVLHAYGRSVLRGPAPFDRWTLGTGSAAQIGDLARFFGVDDRADAGLVVHTLVTAVVDHDGRIARVFPSNSWAPDVMFGLVSEKAARAGDGRPLHTKE